MKGIKPPFAPPQHLNRYIFVVLSIIGTITAISILLYLRRRPRVAITPIEVPPQPSPHELAYQQLKEIKDKNFVAQGKMKAYHIEVSQVIRQYIDARYNIPAFELTTEDLLALLNNESLPEMHSNLIQSFLKNCDLVKFAKYQPTPAEADERMVEARQIVEAQERGQ